MGYYGSILSHNCELCLCPSGPPTPHHRSRFAPRVYCRFCIQPVLVGLGPTLPKKNKKNMDKKKGPCGPFLKLIVVPLRDYWRVIRITLFLFPVITFHLTFSPRHRKRILFWTIRRKCYEVIARNKILTRVPQLTSHLNGTRFIFGLEVHRATSSQIPVISCPYSTNNCKCFHNRRISHNKYNVK